MDVYVNGQCVHLGIKNFIDKGGEAEIYMIGRKYALKLFKGPDHPDFRGNPAAQKGARARLDEHQKKIFQFPKNLPPEVMAPIWPAFDKRQGKLVGYTMAYVSKATPLMRLADRRYRALGIGPQTVVAIFKHLHETLLRLHQKNMVIGDFNDLNVLFKNSRVYLIDTDSYQFNGFICHMYTTRFIDPLVCASHSRALVPEKPFCESTDWYAFCIMFMQSLLFVDPYGGIFRPQKGANVVAHPARPLHRITVFHPQVRYPKQAQPLAGLPDDLRQYFQAVFEKDVRGVFPKKLLDNMNWIACPACGTHHGRKNCPTCRKAKKKCLKLTIIVKGKLKVEQIFQTRGVILAADYHQDRLIWLYHHTGAFYREGPHKIANGDLAPLMNFKIMARRTLMAQNGRLLILTPDQPIKSLAVDECQNAAAFDVNAGHYYWLQNGRLLRNSQLGPEFIGNVIEGHTRFWMGPRFGLGFYTAGHLTVGFVFDARHLGVNDTVRLSFLNGKLIDAAAVFSDDYGWLFTAVKHGGRVVHQCHVIGKNGDVQAMAQGVAGDGGWLSTLQGKAGFGRHLLAPTEDGILRLECKDSSLNITRRYPDTQSFVDGFCRLLPSPAGLYVIKNNRIDLMQLN
jgi:tRNA A-37 threonylcarbamoyl transferase component Bud32